MESNQYPFGIEEEYFVVDRRTGALKTEPSKSFMKAAEKQLGPQLQRELLQSQIEVATRPFTSATDARHQLIEYRRTLAEVGRDHGIGIVAAGTHPLTRPLEQKITRKFRYRRMIDELGIVGLSNPLCGLHVHVEVPAPDQRVEVMHRMVPFLPILLALSTSSPFWSLAETGLLGYRNVANDGLPRTGFPEMFRTDKEYESYVQALCDAKIIPDATYIWWALRPSLRNPTLELRITDSCTSVDDAVAIAGLYRALIKHLVENRKLNSDYSAVTRALAEENRWRAQRYGISGTYIDIDNRKARRFEELLAETLSLVDDDLEELGLESEKAHLSRILMRGTSANQQLEYFRRLREDGKSRVSALRTVVRWLTASTELGDFVEQPEQ